MKIETVTLKVMVARETAASSDLPKLATEKMDATVKEYCKKKVMMRGTEDFEIWPISLHELVDGEPYGYVLDFDIINGVVSDCFILNDVKKETQTIRKRVEIKAGNNGKK